MSEGILSSLFSGEQTGDELEVEQDEAPAAEIQPEIEAPEAETAAPETEVEADPAPTEDRTAEGRLFALMDERERRKEAEGRAKELQAQLDQFQQKANAPQNPYSDNPVLDDFQQHMQQQLQEQLFRERLDDSTERATEQHGKEAVEAAGHWAAAQFANNPTLKSGFLASRRPAEYLVEQHQRDQQVNALMTDREAFIRSEAAKLGMVAADAQAQSGAETPTTQNTTASTRAPRSLASVTGHGAATDVPKGSLGVIGSLFR